MLQLPNDLNKIGQFFSNSVKDTLAVKKNL